MKKENNEIVDVKTLMESSRFYKKCEAHHLLVSKKRYEFEQLFNDIYFRIFRKFKNEKTTEEHVFNFFKLSSRNAIKDEKKRIKRELGLTEDENELSDYEQYQNEVEMGKPEEIEFEINEILFNLIKLLPSFRDTLSKYQSRHSNSGIQNTIEVVKRINVPPSKKEQAVKLIERLQVLNVMQDSKKAA